MCGMIDKDDLEKRTRKLQRLFELQMGVKSRSLAQALRRAGRRLPRKLRRQGKLILRTQQLARNPKLARQIDSAGVENAFAAITAHLEAIDVKDQQKGRIMGIAGIISANLLIVVALFIWWLWWRGYIGV